MLQLQGVHVPDDAVARVAACRDHGAEHAPSDDCLAGDRGATMEHRPERPQKKTGNAFSLLRRLHLVQPRSRLQLAPAVQTNVERGRDGERRRASCASEGLEGKAIRGIPARSLTMAEGLYFTRDELEVLRSPTPAAAPHQATAVASGHHTDSTAASCPACRGIPSTLVTSAAFALQLLAFATPRPSR